MRLHRISLGYAQACFNRAETYARACLLEGPPRSTCLRILCLCAILGLILGSRFGTGLPSADDFAYSNVTYATKMVLLSQNGCFPSSEVTKFDVEATLQSCACQVWVHEIIIGSKPNNEEGIAFVFPSSIHQWYLKQLPYLPHWFLQLTVFI